MSGIPLCSRLLSALNEYIDQFGGFSIIILIYELVSKSKSEIIIYIVRYFRFLFRNFFFAVQHEKKSARKVGKKSNIRLSMRL